MDSQFTQLSKRRRSVQSQLQELDELEVVTSLPEGVRPPVPPAEEKLYYGKRYQVRIVLSILQGSLWGVLARRGLDQLTSYQNSYLGGVVWSNFTACLTMGALVGTEQLWENLNDIKARVPMYVGLTTGFCGTFSSFSSAMLEAVERAINAPLDEVVGPLPSAPYGIMEALSVVIAQLGLSVLGFHMGKHLAEAVDTYVPPLTRKVHIILEYGLIVIGVCIYIAAIVLCGTESNGTLRQWTFSIVFAFFGAWGRFLLSKYLNGKILKFPLGTFIANILGCIVVATAVALSQGKRHSHKNGSNSISNLIVRSAISCEVLAGIRDGFCGALTTVSTFVVELFGLETIHSYRYGSITIVVGFSMCLVILGTVNWTVGLGQAVC